MTKQEALEILYTINEFYPRFNLTKRKAAILIPNLLKMDYQGVLDNLSNFVMESPYPPTLSEIAAYGDDGESAMEEINRWKREAKGISPDVKERFMREFERLAKRKGD